MPITEDEAHDAIDAFYNEYQGLSAAGVKIIHRPTQEHFYGKNNSVEALGYPIKGAFLPRQRHIHLALANFHHTEDLRQSLRHEALGHYGSYTFNSAEKRELLEVIIAARQSPSMQGDWQEIDRSYAGESELIKAEEVFCLAAERVSPATSKTEAEFTRAWSDVITHKTRPLEQADLQAIADGVADGIRRGTRQQQIFPADDRSQFSRSRDDPPHQEHAMSTSDTSHAGQAPATTDEAKSAAKDIRKQAEADAMRLERESEARSWSPEKAKDRAARDVIDHASFEALGTRGESDAFYLRSDMAMQRLVNPAYDTALKEASPDLHARVQTNENEDKGVILSGAGQSKAIDAERTTLDMTEEHKATLDRELDAQLAAQLRQRMDRERELAGQGLNEVNLQRSGKELDRGDFIMPRRIQQTYTEVDGKFFSKESNRVVFEDKGERLATSSTNKEAIADMVAYARAKQWESLKLSGTYDFRREAWLQAESQGLKTQGYTPKQSDLAALETLRQERATNAITPLKERHSEKPGVTVMAPRHDINKNQPVLHVEATKALTTNLQALSGMRGMEDRSAEDLTKLAYWRGVVAEDNKLQPKSVQEEALARFDKLAADPQFLKRLTQETEAQVHDKSTDRVQRRETHEQSL